jgi:hypothetical protein
LALNQEWIELDLFHYGLARFSPEEFEAQGIDAEQQHLIEFMANQEGESDEREPCSQMLTFLIAVGHSTLLTNILQGAGAKQCKYRYNFETVQEFIQFCAVLTRFGESGVYGFLSHLDSRPAATLLLQSITTEARQQMIFRQMAGEQTVLSRTELRLIVILHQVRSPCPSGSKPVSRRPWPGLCLAPT